jgi:hypothetical protein
MTLFFLIQVLPAAESGNWFAVVGSFREFSDAENFANSLSEKNLRPEIYLAENDYYAVTLGGFLDLKQAKHLVAMAKEKGIANDAYVWQSDSWGKNLYKALDSSIATSPNTQKILRAHIVTALYKIVNIRSIISYHGESATLRFKNPNIYLNPYDQGLQIRFDFLYSVRGNYRYQYLKEDSGSGFVTIKTNLIVRDGFLATETLKLHQIEKLDHGTPESYGKADLPEKILAGDQKLPIEVYEAIENDWFYKIKEYLENRGFMKVSFTSAKVDVEYNYVLLNPHQ